MVDQVLHTPHQPQQLSGPSGKRPRKTLSRANIMIYGTLIVVSSDHRVQRAARRRRATAIDSEQWVARVKRKRAPKQADTESHDKLEGDELRAWLDEFGVE